MVTAKLPKEPKTQVSGLKVTLGWTLDHPWHRHT